MARLPDPAVLCLYPPGAVAAAKALLLSSPDVRPEPAPSGALPAGVGWSRKQPSVRVGSQPALG